MILVHHADPQVCVVRLAKVGNVPCAEDAHCPLQECRHSALRISRESGICLTRHFRGICGLDRPLDSRGQLLAELEQLILRCDEILDFEGSVLRPVAEFQGCDDSIGSSVDGGRTEPFVAAVETSHGVLLHVDEHAPGKAEIEQGPGCDAGMGNAGFALLEVLLGADFILVDGQGAM